MGIPATSCNVGGTAGRLAGWSSSPTGTYEPHIAFVDDGGTLQRIRDFSAGGTPTFESYIMPSITALYSFHPLSAPVYSHSKNVLTPPIKSNTISSLRYFLEYILHN